MDGAVFDFDGVIARSMEQHAEAYRRVLAPQGILFPDSRIFALEGARSETILRELGATGDLAKLAGLKQRIFAQMGDPSLYPGAQAIMQSLQGRTKTAVVTGTRQENLARLIPQLLGGFNAVMSQETYTKDKPDPEPYALAAKTLGVAPARLVCIENATRGITSALAAGYQTVVGIATTRAPEDLRAAGATHVVADHAELAALLAEFFGEVGGPKPER